MPVSPWKPSAFAFSVERRIIDQDMVSVSLQHPTWPYIEKLDLPADASVPEATLQRVAHAYLTQANNQKVIDPPIELPEHWLRALEAGDADLMFGWLPIGWPQDALGSDDAPDPMGSYWVNRDEAPVTPEALVTPDKGANKERAAVLLASDRLGDRFYGSGFGIRVVVQVRSDGSDGLEAHITGMTASLPSGIYARGAWGHPWRDQGDANTFLNRLISDDIKRDLETVLGFVEGSVSIRGMRLRWAEGEKPWLVERRGVGIRHGQQLPYAYVVFGTEADVGDVIWVEQHAGRSVGIARIFPIDPASQDKHDGLTRRRPTRTDKQLDAFRANQAIPTSLVLNDSHNRELMRVVPCPRLVREDRSFPADAPKSVNLSSGAPPIRSNDFSAVSAFYNVKQFFDRLDAYGLRPRDHFRVAKLPIKIAYRSGIRPGPGKDGRTVNARVQPENWPIDYPGPTPPGQRPGLEIHLALGDLSHRVRKRWDRTSPSPAVSLGIATDARWIWHEIGHVLLMASVGELEFRFAHSAGDALAAIVSDPHSKLAMDENW